MISPQHIHLDEHGVPMWPSKLDQDFRGFVVARWSAYRRRYGRSKPYLFLLLDLPTPTAQHIRAQRDYAWGVKIGGSRP